MSDTPPNNVAHGSIRYIRSQRHLLGQSREHAASLGGRDDVGAFENETWKGRADAMRKMHLTSPRRSTVTTPSSTFGSGARASTTSAPPAPSQTSATSGALASSLSEPESTSGVSGGGATRRRRARNDDNIWSRVCEVIEGEATIDASDVEVEVALGVVTLKGSVGSRGEKYACEDLAYGVNGVVDVENELEVKRDAMHRLPTTLSAP